MPEVIIECLPNRKLWFRVLTTPATMTELNPFGDPQPGHLHDYFEADTGGFILVPVGKDSTRLIGTSRVRSRYVPAWYWRNWIELYVHATHNLVFDEIERRAESSN